MAIKIHGLAMSSATLRAIVAAHEKELDYELVPVDLMSGAHKQEPYLSLNPFGQIPAYEDGDVKVFESRAITGYIAYTYADQGTPLINKDLKQMADIATWMEVEAHQFDPVASKLAWELKYKSMFGMQTDDKVVEENATKLAKVLDIYEARLGTSKYLAGDSLSLADLHHLPCIQILCDTKLNHLFHERPLVSAWCNDILARPSWKKTVALDEQH